MVLSQSVPTQEVSNTSRSLYVSSTMLTSPALRAAPFSPAHCSSRQPRRARAVRCQANDANAEGIEAPRRGVLGAGVALVAGSLLELGAPQRAGAKVVSSDWELVRRQPAAASYSFCAAPAGRFQQARSACALACAEALFSSGSWCAATAACTSCTCGACSRALCRTKAPG